jgi:hypothetical protein
MSHHAYPVNTFMITSFAFMLKRSFPAEFQMNSLHIAFWGFCLVGFLVGLGFELRA